jgi:hypothetical protein
VEVLHLLGDRGTLRRSRAIILPFSEIILGL